MKGDPYMKKFIEEFKTFALKGNVMDMAIGVIIGGAFASIVSALTDNIINPIIGCFSTGGLEGWTIKVWKAQLGVGAFIMAVINFLILAFVLFLMLKAMNKAMNLRKKPEAPAEPTTKTCPFCQSEISIKATKCPHCTSVLDIEE